MRLFSVELQNLLCVKHFEIKNQQTNLYFVEKTLKHLGIFSRFTLKRGFFSCGFPVKEDLEKVVNYGIKLEDWEIVGPEVFDILSGPTAWRFPDKPN